MFQVRNSFKFIILEYFIWIKSIHESDMEASHQKLRPNPRDSANFFSKIFFIWTIPLFKKVNLIWYNWSIMISSCMSVNLFSLKGLYKNFANGRYVSAIKMWSFWIDGRSFGSVSVLYFQISMVSDCDKIRI